MRAKQKAKPVSRAALAGEADPRLVALSVSIQDDAALYDEDIRGSQAHVDRLAARGIVPKAATRRIVAALDRVRDEFRAGKIRFDPALEDVHTHVERRLGELVGKDAGYLHAGRSRNDQVALDERLFVVGACDRADAALARLMRTLVTRARATSVRMRRTSAPSARSHAPTMKSRSSSATWSFRLRPAWRYPASFPTSSPSRRSTCVCTSSRAGSKRILPVRNSSRTRSSPATIRRAAAFGTMPRAASRVTCAWLPRMSSSYSAASSWIDTDSATSRGSASPASAARETGFAFSFALIRERGSYHAAARPGTLGARSGSTTARRANAWRARRARWSSPCPGGSGWTPRSGST